MLHHVVDRHPGVGQPAWRVDVQEDVLAGVGAVQVEDLGHQQVGDLVVDLLAEEDDPFAQQERVDVEGPLAPGGLVEHRGYYRH